MGSNISIDRLGHVPNTSTFEYRLMSFINYVNMTPTSVAVFRY